MKFMTSLILFFITLSSISASETEQKIDDLISRMTPEEKIGQMTQYNGDHPQALQLIKEGKVGSFLNMSGSVLINSFQKAAVSESRLGIPLIMGHDVIHGFRTVFPIPLAETATFNPELVRKTAAVSAKEASAAGIRWTFAPMVDIARDARWGRISEGAGEDTYLGCIMARARVLGFQGTSLADPSSVAACAKHFAAYGAAESGKDYNIADLSENTLYNVYLPPFRAAVDAGVRTLMCSFNEINGIPSSANKTLLTDVLRKSWGFTGFVVSDWESIAEMEKHGNAENRTQAGVLSVNAGLDMEMVSGIYQNQILPLLKNNQISSRLIDESVKRILRVKSELGLFEYPFTDEEREKTELLHPDHLALARECAVQSMVLLKNENSLLPITDKYKKIALIGPLADSSMDPLGWWSCQGRTSETVTVLKGLENRFSAEKQICSARGCSISTQDTEELESACRIASESDLAVIIAGESYDMSGEGGSRAFLGLPGIQLDLIRKVIQTGVPTAVVIMCGRPVSIPWIAQNAQAVVLAWQPGTQCGNALADLLSGDRNFSGKLPVSLPRDAGQEPLYYNHKNTGRPADSWRHTCKYIDLPVTPEYPFGYGLCYTSFCYENLFQSSSEISCSGKFKVSASVRNTGNSAGTEVVQLYIRDLHGSITRPVKELKGFLRLNLNPGESATAEFEIGPDQLGFFNSDLRYVVEPGRFQYWIGGSSVTGLTGEFTVR